VSDGTRVVFFLFFNTQGSPPHERRYDREFDPASKKSGDRSCTGLQ